MDRNLFEEATREPDYLSGHRKITFSSEITEREDTSEWLRQAELLLIEDNRIVASTAKSGRLAAGEWFFAHDRARFQPLVRAACAQDEKLCALPYLRGTALVGGALAADTGLLLAFVFPKSPARILRLLARCFAGMVDLHAFGEEAVTATQASLRQEDEAAHDALQCIFWNHLRLCRMAKSGATPHTQEELMRFASAYQNTIFGMLGQPTPQASAEPIPPFPCEGSVNGAALAAITLCMALALRHYPTKHGAPTVRLIPDDGRLYPHTLITVTQPSGRSAASAQEAAWTHAARIALQHGMPFEWERIPLHTTAEQILVRFTPFCPARDELYTLRSRLHLD